MNAFVEKIKGVLLFSIIIIIGLVFYITDLLAEKAINKKKNRYHENNPD